MTKENKKDIATAIQKNIQQNPCVIPELAIEQRIESKSPIPIII